MKQRIKVDDLPQFDAAQYLRTDDAIVAYLTSIIEENNSELLKAALDDVTRAVALNAQPAPFLP